ncbi:hypothetical protein [Hafnia phage Pocis76]|uniref:Uncharacterized protein n=1 Tax=Hafnia phage Pocis76 TaxID=2831174 RepID=A0A8E7FMF8_9CAUD|nr:hypothetical protein [Hafnia phage Pocis76]
MLMFIVGFISCFVLALLAVFVSKAKLNKLIESGKYAAAIYNEKEKRWEVGGRYLSIAAKIKTGIVANNGSVKYTD